MFSLLSELMSDNGVLIVTALMLKLHIGTVLGASHSLFQSNSSLTGLQKSRCCHLHLTDKKLRLKKIHGLLKSDTGFKWESKNMN